MRIRVISRETFNEILVNVPENIRVRDFKRKIYEQTGDNSIKYSNLCFDGEILYENGYLRDYDIEDMDQILIQRHYIGGGLELENSVYSTNIHAVIKKRKCW